MERRERSSTHHQVREAATAIPSFSSTLLDAIYRSIDEGKDNDHCKGENRVRNYRGNRSKLSITSITTMEMKKQVTSTVDKKKQIAATMVTDKVMLGQSDYKPQQHHRREMKKNCVLNTNSRSPESSYGKGEPPALGMKKQKQNQDNSKSIGNRLRAWKIYREMKKAKKIPISPGGRLASFINQLFTSASHPKKVKTTSQEADTVRRDVSTCSSASSNSRSCLSKTPPSITKSKSASNDGKRSVKFYPEDDLQGLTHPYKLKEFPLLPPPLPAVKVPAAEEFVKDLIRNGKNIALDVSFEEDEDEEEEDAASYSSSDLFELENFTVIEGVDGELPVFETTHLHY